MKRPTLADVAAVAQVSPKTVSNVLRGRPLASKATQERVWQAVASVGYRVNRAGRALAGGGTGRIAVVVPNLHQPYYAENAERLILALADRGLTSTLRIAPDAASEREAVFGGTTADADGVIVLPHFINTEVLGGMAPDRPVVQFGSRPTGLLDTVVMGEREGFSAVTRHLLDTGRRRLALVWNATQSGRPEGRRFEGFEEALAEYGLEPDPALMAAGSDWDWRAPGFEAMTGLLASGARFDAVLCINDSVAVGALRALRVGGVRVPDDVALTGFDDTDEAEFTVPPLTTVSPEHEAMVDAAVRMMVDRLGGEAGPPRVRQTGAHLIPRASSGVPR
ncbi:LacI family DNA-binding transcriptional regulator [Glycomyces harbinensis]|uniref:DNA-binding transcriptional regulator, LacI/PurR family n=1 Tax=Glycomyces harbinensis TaxID=58114 RepID=A0A1G7DD68_9ACTN|nr:LacI family DNA-binding transcriptional regulator [Glycomyces harbinensis]SDE49482.1 DNA-binding transcriptional regulator, LacI/PurR family [Glycomyces harbinensis]